MNIKVKFSILTAVVLWASAFVAIRVGLQHFSPEGLGLARCLIASGLFALVCVTRTQSRKMTYKQRLGLIATGALGIGFYNIALNYGEINVPSGEASFIIAQAPLITAILAFFFLNEKMNVLRYIGLAISIFGMALMTMNDHGAFQIDRYFFYVAAATIIGSVFSVLNKQLLKNCDPLQATAHLVWGGTLFLLLFTPNLWHDIQHLASQDWFAVLYLGAFPSTLGYLAWSYVLSHTPVSRAVTYLYFMPFVATILGWLTLGEIPAALSLIGGAVAMLGVFVVDRSYKVRLVVSEAKLSSASA